MSTIYDRQKKGSILKSESFSHSSMNNIDSSIGKEDETNEVLPASFGRSTLPTTELNGQNTKELQSYFQNASNALSVIDDVVLKQYLTKLKHLDIVENTESEIGENVILYKINKMAYEKDEFATEKFISAISAMTYVECSVFLIVDGYSNHTDFYLGVKNSDESKTDSSVAKTFEASIKGQFPGVSMTDCSIIEKGKESSDQKRLLQKISEAKSISSCVGVPSFKDEDGNYTNASYVQGIEKLALAMQGRRYTAIILANNITPSGIVEIRQGYENLYTQLSAVATQQVAYSTNESLANAISRSKAITTSESETLTNSVSQTHSEGTGTAHSENYNESTRGGLAKAASIIGGTLAAVGGLALMATGVGAPAGIALVAGAGLGAAGASGKQKSKGNTNAKSTSVNDSTSNSQSKARSTSRSETLTQTDGQTATISEGKNFTLTLHNKHIEELQKRIDKQLERIAMSESTGLWSVSTYFFSYDNDFASAETGATIFRSIMQGETSGVEASAVNTWIDNNNPEPKGDVTKLNNYVCRFQHPIFKYQSLSNAHDILVENSSLVSSKELSMLLGLPRKSVPGFPVIEHISLAKEVVRQDGKRPRRLLRLGSIYDQGVEHKENPVELDVKSLTQHVFVTGSTGCGKSNTIYYLIRQIRNQANSPKFMAIEPAKGEYKDVFGNEHIYGTNPLKTPLLKINPFRFPEGVHVLEHIDRLVEIFNVCWPMYAAMPAVIKEAIINSYEDCGWDLYNSTNKFSNDLFPTFADLLNELVLVINSSAYSDEVKSNYQGSLVTRVKSLNNGLCRQIFSGQELGDAALYDENVIVDLSRIGSQETKSLIMGILIMRLNEYRSNSNIGHNSELRHITILEEAHNILKRDYVDNIGEQGNVAGKSVEMISNAIAEMRTYGEGFIIVDQSPGAVDESAIRNTNTKIIMRLPDDTDRKVAGKASGMKDSQVDEIAKLPTGVAVVYQNDWEEPVLCKIGKFEDKEIKFEFNPEDKKEILFQESAVKSEVLKLLLKGRITENIDANIDMIEDNLARLNLSTFNKIAVYDSLKEFKVSGKLHLWNDNQFEKLSRLVTETLNARSEVAKFADCASTFDELTDTLEHYIKNSIPEFPNELSLVTSQCLMRDYSLASEVQKRIYSAWFQNVRKMM